MSRRKLRAAALLAASVLLAVGPGTSQPAQAQPVELRIETMRVVADDTYRAQANWEANLRAPVATGADIYERNFQIRFVILDIVPWTAGALAGERSLQEAIKLDPSFAEPYVGLGVLSSARGELEDAARELRTAKALDFRLVHARTDLGFVLFLLGRNEEALGEFREVLRVDPRLARASSGVGMTLVRLGRVDEAIGVYDEALRLAPSDAHALCGRCLAKRKKGDLTGSDADLAAARTISPRVAEDYATYGVPRTIG